MIFMTHPRQKLKSQMWPMLTAILVAAGIASGCGNSPAKSADDPANAPSAAVVKVVRRDLTSNLEIASEFQPYQEIQVYAKVSGYIQKSYVDWGMHVKQGQLLAVLEIPELQQQLQQDEASLKRSQQALEGAREELKRAESVYNVAHLTYSRIAEVQKTRPDLLAQQDVDIAQGKDVEAGAGVSSAKDGQAAAEQGVAGARAALDKDKAMFGYARITAPFDGVVTQVYAFTGALLPAGTSSGKDTLALCQLSQNNLLRLVIPLPERAVSDVHIGENVAVRLTNPPKTFPGTIVQFSDQIDEQTRTMHAEVHVPNPKGELVAGMYASVLIPLHTAKNVLTLPIQVLQSAKESQGTVMVVNSKDRIEQRTVTLGLQTATQVEIVSGLQENDMVIFGEQAQYQIGELVSPKVVESGGKE
jgi:RND family efflux transporter MFP subunit